MIQKLAGRAWIDEEDRQLVRLEARLLDTLGVGPARVARLQKGASAYFQRRKINGEIWLPSEARFTGEAKVLLVFGARVDIFFAVLRLQEVLRRHRGGDRAGGAAGRLTARTALWRGGPQGLDRRELLEEREPVDRNHGNLRARLGDADSPARAPHGGVPLDRSGAAPSSVARSLFFSRTPSAANASVCVSVRRRRAPSPSERIASPSVFPPECPSRPEAA